MFVRSIRVASIAWATAASAGVDTARYSADMRTLSSDEFEGRGPTSAGEAKTVEFITRRFVEVGLQPGGTDGGWTQNVEAFRFTLTGPVTASARAGATARSFAQRDDIVLFTRNEGSRVDIANAPMVFVGHAISATDRGWDDLGDTNLAGKVAVVLVNEPDFGEKNGPFDGDALTYHGMTRTKAQNLARRGAIGVLYMHDAERVGWEWPTAQNSFTQPQFDIAGAGAHAMFEGWLSSDAAATLFAIGGQELAALRAKALKAGFRPVPLGATFSAAFDYRTDSVRTPNVIGILKGASRPDEYVIYTAHWDHLGRRADGNDGDAIFNGAVDNATGIAALIEIARNMNAGPRPQRSVVFIATTLEEKGLLGARYYVQNPAYRLARTVAALNIDSLMPFGLARDMTIVGPGKSNLDAYFTRHLAAQQRRLTPDPHPGVGAYYRADHFPFAEAGVPATFLSSGGDLVEGGKEAGDRWALDYVTKRYHQPPDEWSADMDFRGTAQDLEVFLKAGLDLANTTDWPAWSANSEFRAVREQSAAARR